MNEGDLPPPGYLDRLRFYRLPIVLGAVSIFSILIAIILLVKSIQTAVPIRFSEDEASGSALGISSVVVDVEGSVSRPGVYTLPAGSRVEDALNAAGGLLPDADAVLFGKTFNRAMKLSDGAKLYVPSMSGGQTSHNIDCTTLNVKDPNVAQSCSIVATPETSSQHGTVSVNYASLSELDLLSGVGPVTAQKIIDNRPYQTLEELVTKKAIGPSLFEKLKDILTL